MEHDDLAVCRHLEIELDAIACAAGGLEGRKRVFRGDGRALRSAGAVSAATGQTARDHEVLAHWLRELVLSPSIIADVAGSSIAGAIGTGRLRIAGTGIMQATMGEGDGGNGRPGIMVGARRRQARILQAAQERRARSDGQQPGPGSSHEACQQMTRIMRRRT